MGGDSPPLWSGSSGARGLAWVDAVETDARQSPGCGALPASLLYALGS